MSQLDAYFNQQYQQYMRACDDEAAREAGEENQENAD